MEESLQSEPKLRIAILAANGIGAAALLALLGDQRSLKPVVRLDPQDYESLGHHDVDVVLSDVAWTFDLESVEDSHLPLPETGRIEELPTVGLVSDRDQAADAWRAGYRSLILRSESPSALVAALHATASGLWVLSPQLAGTLSASITPDAGYEFEKLTDREHQVLGLLAEGLTNRTIAHRLDISEHTVKFHVNAILSKLSAESRTDAVVRATRAGLILL